MFPERAGAAKATATPFATNSVKEDHQVAATPLAILPEIEAQFLSRLGTLTDSLQSMKFKDNSIDPEMFEAIKRYETNQEIAWQELLNKHETLLADMETLASKQAEELKIVKGNRKTVLNHRRQEILELQEKVMALEKFHKAVDEINQEHTKWLERLEDEAIKALTDRVTRIESSLTSPSGRLAALETRLKQLENLGERVVALEQSPGSSEEDSEEPQELERLSESLKQLGDKHSDLLQRVTALEEHNASSAFDVPGMESAMQTPFTPNSPLWPSKRQRTEGKYSAHSAVRSMMKTHTISRWLATDA